MNRERDARRRLQAIADALGLPLEAFHQAEERPLLSRFLELPEAEALMRACLALPTADLRTQAISRLEELQPRRRDER